MYIELPKATLSLSVFSVTLTDNELDAVLERYPFLLLFFFVLFVYSFVRGQR